MQKTPASWFAARAPGFFFWFFVVMLAAVLVLTIFFRQPYAHYLIFSRAALEFFAQQNPHPLHPESYAALWLYSPSAALFFLPFAELPYRIGHGLYLVVSLAVFVFGLLKILRVSTGGSSPRNFGFLFAVASSEVVGATQQAKLEIITVGILFWVFSWVIEKKNWAVAGALLGWTASWKFQTLPVAGLLVGLLALTVPAKTVARFVLAMILILALCGLYPYALFPAGFVDEVYRRWLQTLSESVAQTWHGYSSLLSFFWVHLGWPSTIAQTRWLSLPAAALCAGLVAQVGLRTRKLRTAGVWAPVALLPLALGCTYTTLFSPLTQGSGFILTVPLLVAFFERRRTREIKIQQRLDFAVMAFWFLTSLVHSDLVPASWRALAGALRLRPLGVAVLAAVYVGMVLADLLRRAGRVGRAVASLE